MDMHVDRFAAMGTRIEVHVFGPADDRILALARREIEAVDDALTIHRPSPATIVNEFLRAGRPAPLGDPLLLQALIEAEAARAETGGLFDPAADVGHGNWDAVSFDREARRLSVSRPVGLDFGGFGKGYALDRACRALRAEGVLSAFLSAGESSIAVIGQHPLGGKWSISVPNPRDARDVLVELELEDEGLSVSSTFGGAADRSAMIRPADGSLVTAPRTTVAVNRSAALAEALSTALLVARQDEGPQLVAQQPERRFIFDFGDPDACGSPRQRDVPAA